MRLAETGTHGALCWFEATFLPAETGTPQIFFGTVVSLFQPAPAQPVHTGGSGPPAQKRVRTMLRRGIQSRRRPPPGLRRIGYALAAVAWPPRSQNRVRIEIA